MSDRRTSVVITGKSGTAPWQAPDRLWRRLALLRRVRMRRTMSQHVLPVLQRLEGLYLRDNLGAKPRLVDKTLGQVEKDDLAIEAGIYLIDLAISEGIIVFKGKGTEGKGASSVPVGGCQMSVEEVKRHYLDLAARIILEKSGHKIKKHREYLASVEIEDAQTLTKFRTVVRFDALSVSELSKGLSGRLRKLMEADDQYLAVLNKCRPIHFLRALRYALGKEFPAILKWTPEFIEAVAEGLDHSAKITALGESLLTIEDPEVIRALGTWPVKEVKAGKDKEKKKYITRIEQVKAKMGTEFAALLACSPDVIRESSHWKIAEIEQIRHYLAHVDGAVMDAMAPLAFAQKVGLLDGLWDKLGRRFVEVNLKQPGGVSVVANIVAELAEMTERGTVAKDIKGLIVGSDIFAKHMKSYLRR